MSFPTVHVPLPNVVVGPGAVVGGAAVVDVVVVVVPGPDALDVVPVDAADVSVVARVVPGDVEVVAGADVPAFPGGFFDVLVVAMITMNSSTIAATTKGHRLRRRGPTLGACSPGARLGDVADVGRSVIGSPASRNRSDNDQRRWYPLHSQCARGAVGLGREDSRRGHPGHPHPPPPPARLVATGRFLVDADRVGYGVRVALASGLAMLPLARVGMTEQS